MVDQFQDSVVAGKPKTDKQTRPRLRLKYAVPKGMTVSKEKRSTSLRKK